MVSNMSMTLESVLRRDLVKIVNTIKSCLGQKFQDFIFAPEVFAP